MDKYTEFMYNPQNAFHCECCPENKGIEGAGRVAGPCGQQNCWVLCHCNKDEEEGDE